MAHGAERQPKAPPAAGGPRSSATKHPRKTTTLLPGFLHAELQSRQLITSVRLKPAGVAHSARAPLPSGRCSAAGPAAPLSAPPAAGRLGVRTYVPVRTLPLIFAQRKRHLQEHKAQAQHAEPYQRRQGEGLLALPEDVLLKVVCSLTHDELKPLFQVCKALRDTLRQAVRYHFNYSTPSRPTEEAAPPALGERQRRPPRSNVYQVMSRLSQRGGGRGAGPSGRATGASARSTAPRALDFADQPPSSAPPVVASRA